MVSLQRGQQRADSSAGGNKPESLSQASDNLDTLPVTVLRGVGPRVAERLQRLNIRTLQDVLFHLPARYEDRTRVTPMGAVQSGQQVVVQGEVDLAEVRFGRRLSLIHISEPTRLKTRSRMPSSA